MTAVICCAGAGVLFLAAEELQEKLPRKILAGMVVFNFASAWFLHTHYGSSLFLILKYLTLSAFMWVCAWTDYRKFLILNRVLLLALAVYAGWAAAAFLLYGTQEFSAMLITGGIAAGMLAAAALLCKLVSSGGVGFGDVKLLIVLGLYAGVNPAVEILIYTFLVMFVVSVFLLVTKKATRKSVIPFAPFLLIGTVAAAFLTGI